MSEGSEVRINRLFEDYANVTEAEKYRNISLSEWQTCLPSSVLHAWWYCITNKVACEQKDRIKKKNYDPLTRPLTKLLGIAQLHYGAPSPDAVLAVKPPDHCRTGADVDDAEPDMATMSSRTVALGAVCQQPALQKTDHLRRQEQRCVRKSLACCRIDSP